MQFTVAEYSKDVQAVKHIFRIILAVLNFIILNSQIKKKKEIISGTPSCSHFSL